MKYEHFETAIIEAMSVGLVPIVHKSGSPWIDILCMKQDKYGYAYKISEEASALISELLVNESLRMEVVTRAQRRVILFFII